jgi:hypothetical protein
MKTCESSFRPCEYVGRKEGMADSGGKGRKGKIQGERGRKREEGGSQLQSTRSHASLVICCPLCAPLRPHNDCPTLTRQPPHPPRATSHRPFRSNAAPSPGETAGPFIHHRHNYPSSLVPDSRLYSSSKIDLVGWGGNDERTVERVEGRWRACRGFK